MELEEIHQDVLGGCAHDDMSLTRVARQVSEDAFHKRVMPEWVRRSTIQVIAHLLERGLIEVGTPNGPTFRPFSSSLEETLRIIEREWDMLGGAWPHPGDVCWIRATPKGTQLSDEHGWEA